MVRLLAAGADPNVTAPIHDSANPGHTALLIAARDGLAVAVHALLDAGAEITRVDHFMLAHPAHKAAYMGHADVMRVLAAAPNFERIANAQGPFNGYTALHDAVWHGHGETVRILLDAGVGLEPRGHDGRTASDMARDYGYHEIVLMLDTAAAHE
ncbi:ankyrin repeat domain-containing protein, partial [Rhizobiaceae sp. 2RAB30]